MKIAIIGAGIAGLCTAWSAVKQGRQVTLFEQAPEIPNLLSASGDQHRMIRRAYSGLEAYGALIGEAFEAWDELWGDLGETFYAPRGVLAINQYPNDFGVGFAGSMRRGGYAFESLTAQAAAERFPFLDPDSFREAYYSPEGGPLFCQRIAAALAAWLTRHGAAVRPGMKITGVDGAAGTVTLASGEVQAFDRVVVTAGAWVLRLFPMLADSLTVCRTTAVYVTPPTPLRAAWQDAPAVQSIGGILSGYILPPANGTELKFAAGSFRRLSHDADADRDATADEGVRMRALFAPPLKDVAAYDILRTITCVYTFTEDLHFFARSFGKALVVSPCSGHGYKFGAAVGRRVADVLADNDTDRLLRWLRAEDVSPSHRLSGRMS